MSSDRTSAGRGDGVLGSLLAPLRLPERLLGALDTLADSARELGPIRSELSRVGKQTEPLAELLPALRDIETGLGTRLDAVREVVQALESEESHLNRAVSDLSDRVRALNDTLAPVDSRLEALERVTERLSREVGAIHETVRGVQNDIQRMSGLRGERGPMERARDVLTGGKDPAPGDSDE